MALEKREVKGGPRRPTGGYQHGIKTLARGAGEVKDPRVGARPIKAGQTTNKFTGRRVTARRKTGGDPVLDLKSRTIV